MNMGNMSKNKPIQSFQFAAPLNQQNNTAINQNQFPVNIEVQDQLNRYNLSSELLPKIKKVAAKTLRIQCQPRPNIIKQICHIEFEFLVNLNLRNSKIQSIDGIEYLNCPQLVCLQLYNNQITSLKPIIRNQIIKKLFSFTFYSNPLKNKWQIERQYRQTSNHFQFEVSSESSCTIQTLEFVIKTPCKLVGLSIKNKNRINQPKFLSCLQRKSIEIGKK